MKTTDFSTNVWLFVDYVSNYFCWVLSRTVTVHFKINL